ncbi:DNA-binding LacI/PurR family transcriptional regulator [Microbacterium terrae]|uniref:Ribose operon repressor n=2 Tax=Microbacterium terrae TaxID=69369 RepID=A0A0M2HFF5_9MICO|nr:LacI family DNA-binding transcriptional regulator [Microbacterium terrae]KJL42988.1 Ribose operon repressor [Microbacterium terrae]MBP1079312.1 DNA-binding LacI/PurR family transcriptional regulator [Microbacterium terrae]GLJ98711.1 LacI family transcriptional regulator [Microbacterium terrae]
MTSDDAQPRDDAGAGVPASLPDRPAPLRRKPRAAVTMHEVAARARVSIKTVSNVVNGYPHIRPATKERVEKAIAELGYKVNMSARSLRKGRAGVIGLALPELALPYFAELADAVMVAAEKHGVSVLIEHTAAQREREFEVLRSPRRSLTDGLLFSPLEMGQDDVGALNVDYPLVLLGERIFGGPVDHVTMANVDGARAATAHLIERGARRIAVVGGHEGEVVGSAALRTTGYRRALDDAGIAFDPVLVREAGLWHRSTGAEAVRRMIDEGVEFDAVFGLNDALALGALHELHQRHIDVPGRVKVIGFDDIEDAAYATPTLSTISPGKAQIAQTAVDFIVERIMEPDLLIGPRYVEAAYAVVARESTGG